MHGGVADLAAGHGKSERDFLQGCVLDGVLCRKMKLPEPPSLFRIGQMKLHHDINAPPERAVGVLNHVSDHNDNPGITLQPLHYIVGFTVRVSIAISLIANSARMQRATA